MHTPYKPTSSLRTPGRTRRSPSLAIQLLGGTALFALTLGVTAEHRADQDRSAGVALSLAGSSAQAKGGMPEDILKGQLIVSDESFPTKWTSPGEYASRVKKMHKQSLSYDKKTGKLQVYYAAFFAQPVPDIQVNFVIYDITNGVANKAKKGAWEAFLGRKGERALFNSVELDKEDIEMNKKYMFAVEYQRKIIASGEIILKGEAPKYSGKVDFSEEETKKKE